MTIQIMSQDLKFDWCDLYIMVTNNKILLSLYGRYLVMDLDCDPAGYGSFMLFRQLISSCYQLLPLYVVCNQLNCEYTVYIVISDILCI